MSREKQENRDAQRERERESKKAECNLETIQKKNKHEKYKNERGTEIEKLKSRNFEYEKTFNTRESIEKRREKAGN